MRPIALILVGSAVLAGCGSSSTVITITDRVTETVYTQPGSTVAVPSSGPLAKGGYAEIVRGLRKLLGGDPIVLEVLVYTDQVRFRVYARDGSKNVDDYWWRGGVLMPPEPYKYSSSEDLDRESFALESISADGPYRLAAAASKIELDGAAKSTVAVFASRGYGPDDSRPVRLTTSLSGTRHDIYLTADALGTIVERRDS